MTPEQQGAAERAAQTAIKRRHARGPDIEDIRQEACLIALECIAEGTTDPSHIYNAVRGKLRDADEDQPAQLRRNVADAPDVTSALRSDLVELLSVVDLTPREREAVRLLHVEKLTDEDAASKMGVTLASFRVYAANGRRKLRDHVSASDDT